MEHQDQCFREACTSFIVALQSSHCGNPGDMNPEADHVADQVATETASDMECAMASDMDMACELLCEMASGIADAARHIPHDMEGRCSSLRKTWSLVAHVLRLGMAPSDLSLVEEFLLVIRYVRECDRPPTTRVLCVMFVCSVNLSRLHERREVFTFMTQYLDKAQPGVLLGRALQNELESLESVSNAVFEDQLAKKSLYLVPQDPDGHCMAHCGIYHDPYPAFG